MIILVDKVYEMTWIHGKHRRKPFVCRVPPTNKKVN